MWCRSLLSHWFVFWRQVFSLRKEGNTHAVVTTFLELVIWFGALYLRFCIMDFTSSLLLKEAVPLLAAYYYNFSFVGSVLVCLVNQLCSKTWQNPFFYWVSFLLGYRPEQARHSLGWVPDLQKTGDDCVAGGHVGGWAKTGQLPIFLPRCPLQNLCLTLFCRTLFLCLSHHMWFPSESDGLGPDSSAHLAGSIASKAIPVQLQYCNPRASSVHRHRWSCCVGLEGT